VKQNLNDSLEAIPYRLLNWQCCPAELSTTAPDNTTANKPTLLAMQLRMIWQQTSACEALSKSQSPSSSAKSTS